MRSGGSWHSNLTLQQVLFEAPRLLQVIPKRDLAALVATSRGLQKCCHAYVTSIKAVETADTQLLIGREWPLLQKLGLHCFGKPHVKDVRALSGARWPALTDLDLTCIHLDEHAALALASGNFPSLTAVNLEGCCLDTAAIEELVKAPWPLLEKLNLSDNLLIGCKAAEYLVHADWPLLKALDVSYTCVL